MAGVHVMKNMPTKPVHGVTVNASPVEVAKPFFTTHKEQLDQATKEPLNLCTILTGNHIFEGEAQKTTEAYKVDIDEELFTPVKIWDSMLTDKTNTLIQLCHVAFAQHRPMALTPDLLWHYIAKGIAIHVNKHSAILQKKLVKHKGKKDLIVTSYKDMQTVNDWSMALKDFRHQIAENLTDEGKVLISSGFSTTSDVIEDVACIALMDTMSQYFRYIMYCICGIPSVTLLGTKEDWNELKDRSKHVLDLLCTDDVDDMVSLKWWKPALLSALGKLIECYDNPDDAGNQDWMSRIYKSGGIEYGNHTTVCGWVNVFFPYLGQGLGRGGYFINEYANNILLMIDDQKDREGNLVKKGYCSYAEEQQQPRGFSFGHRNREGELNGNSSTQYPRAISTANFDYVTYSEGNKDVNPSMAETSASSDEDMKPKWKKMRCEIEEFAKAECNKAKKTNSDSVCNQMRTKKMSFRGGPCFISEQKEQGNYPCLPGTLHANFAWVIKHESNTVRG